MGIRAGLGVAVGKFGYIWTKVGKSRQVWIGQTDQVVMGDIASG